MRKLFSSLLALLIVLGAPGLPAYRAAAAEIEVKALSAVQLKPVGAELPATATLSQLPSLPQIPQLEVSAAPTLDALPAQAQAVLVAQQGLVHAATTAEQAQRDAEAGVFSKAVQAQLNDPFGHALSPQTLAEVTLDIDPQRAYYPSPEDWRDESTYFIFLDRFARGKDYIPHGDPKDGVSRHGGNLKGLTEKMGYLAASGVTTIMLSPVVLNLDDSYHGYAPIHMMAVDPHLGTMEDFKAMVAEAHKNGIRVIMDWVTNHSGPIFEYKEGSRYRGDGSPKEIGERTADFYPKELASDDNFTRRGVIDNWNDHGQATQGDFPPNYRHFAGDNPVTQDRLVKVALWWMKETDIDGARLDAIRHFAPGLFQRLSREMHSYAAKLGKKNFWIVGENSTGVDSEIVPFMGKDGIDSAYNYPAYRRENYALHGKAPTSQFEDSTKKTLEALGDKAGHLLRFIDNQDTYRFLRASEPASILKLALAYMFFATGIPMVYYGTEQGFRQVIEDLGPENPLMPADPRNREDMFEGGQFKGKSSAGNKFDENSETFRWLAKVAQTRKDLAPLRRGEQYFRWSDSNGAGISAFSRIYNGQEVLVVMNTAQEARSADMWVDGGITPAGTALADALDSGYTVVTHAPQEGGSKVTVQVPPHGVRVLVRSVKP